MTVVAGAAAEEFGRRRPPVGDPVVAAVGDVAHRVGVKPLITVRITGLQHDFLPFNGVGGVLKSLTFPPLTTSMLGRWFEPS